MLTAEIKQYIYIYSPFAFIYEIEYLFHFDVRPFDYIFVFKSTLMCLSIKK